MRFSKSPIALAALAVCSGLPIVAQAAAPTVSWSAPKSGATLSGTLNGSSCAASASSNTTRVVFWANGAQINNDYGAPWNCTLDSTKLPDGSYTLKAVAYNDREGSSTTASIPVTINNSGGSTSGDTSAPVGTTATPAPMAGSLNVWFKAPTAGSTVNGVLSGGTSCYANTSGSTARVVFSMDGTALNTDSSPSDGTQCVLDTTKFANGTHSLRADVFDASGAQRTDIISVNVQNTVANKAPTVSLTSPTSGQTASGTLAYAASASDDAKVTKVDFFLDSASTPMLSDSAAPYSGSLDASKLAAGTHKIVARAYDAQGLNASSEVSFNVPAPSTGGDTGSTATPGPFSGSLNVWFKAPTAGSTVKGVLSGGTSCYANTSGSPARVVFSMDSTALNTDSAPSDGTQCVLDTTKFANGTHSLKAQVFDASGNSRIDLISVNVQNTVANKAPTVSLTSPTSGQTASGTLAYAATATDDVKVTKVDFFLDSASNAMLSDSAAPYSGSLDASKLAAGTHKIVARAYDAQGLTASSEVSFNVPAPSTGGGTGGTATPAPMAGNLDVWFKAPSAGSTVKGVLSGGTSCYSNTSGTPARVVFSLDTTALNTDSTPADGTQCVLDTTKFANGTHSLKAQVFDAAGNSKVDVISVNVQNTVVTPPGGDTGSGSGGGATLPAGGSAVTTFHSAGLYWKPPSSPGSTGCIVQYRKQGETTWHKGLNLWYDSRNAECRGSLVQLTPGTTYDVQMGVGSTYSAQTTAKTWNETFPIAKTITVGSQSTLNITESGSASGYVLYQAAPGAVIDASSQSIGINVNANFVIVRGFTVRGAKNHGILMQPGRHDIVIEKNDVSGWGTYRTTPTGGWSIGLDEESGITARCYNSVPEVYRVVIQRNKVHDPRYGANSWDWGHPAGPNGISMYECGGNNVIRYNEVYSTTGTQHYYMDGIGGGNNDSNKGFPGADSDIYGNRVQHAWDDGIEAEGGGRNVRVWSNYVDSTAVGIATTPVAIGPTYVFRNVYNRSRQRVLQPTDNDERNNFSKSGSWAGYGNGRRYVLHNTTLQATALGATYPLGAGGGILNSGSSEPLTNTMSRNNILHIWKSWWTAIGQGSGGANNDADYDLYNGALSISGAESHGIVGTPVYASGNGWQSEAGGMYQLAPSSPGFGKGVKLPGFNDGAAAPDMGAQQSGAPAMKFGVNQ
jgi:hypothetical protein